MQNMDDEKQSVPPSSQICLRIYEWILLVVIVNSSFGAYKSSIEGIKQGKDFWLKLSRRSKIVFT